MHHKCEFPTPIARLGQWLKRQVALPGLAALAALAVSSMSEAAAAKKNQNPKRADFGYSSPHGVPVLAVVALSDQRVTIYDANGKILQSPVSTGQKGYETPAGIYSVVEKNREHYSNVYEGASMPFMQRLTWSGIALHAGVLPGHPASHGCIRMPNAFAKELFELTKVGLRVVVVRDDMSPVDIVHPALPKPGPIKSAGALAMLHERVLDVSHTLNAETRRTHTWRSIAVAKAAAASVAAKRANEAKRAAVKADSQAAEVARSLRLAEAARMSAETQLKLAQRGLESATFPS
jgi:L,D-transpeptidase catalytic domain